ncbi:MAG: dihydrodipicolinate synthase family protein [Hyphomicrobiales bacterium]|nr:dihydrodipicolinate synthase family protein [Hyphomicrobiales bacterium]
MAERNELRGIFAAVLTPLDAELRPDVERFAAHCRWLLDNGCDGLAPLGTTGEANSLAISDRMALIEGAAEAGLPMERMIFGTGTPALHDTVALSRAALEAGAGGLLLLPPFYYKNPSEDGLFAAFAGLADRIGDLASRIYLYHFPQTSAVPITLSLTARLREAFPGIFVGMKDSSGDFPNTKAFITAFPGFDVFSGSEEFLLDNLKASGTGCISATTNVTARLASRVLKAWRAGDAAAAEEAQQTATRARRVISQYPTIPALKAIVARARGDRAWLNMLPPQRPLDTAQTDALFAALAPIDGFSEFRPL